MPILAQTDLNIVHEIGVSKSNEAMKVQFEFNVTNAFNNASILAVNPNPFGGATNAEFLKFDASPTSSGAGIKPALTYNFPAALGGYDPIALINGEANGTSSLSLACAGCSTVGGSPATSPTSNTLVYNNRYGQPILYQNRRTMRIAIRFTF